MRKNRFKMLTLKECIYFLFKFKEARLSILKNNEDFDFFINILEEFGSFICTNKNSITLNEYESAIKQYQKLHLGNIYVSSFNAEFLIVRTARNEAYHQGVHARNLSKHCIELSFIIEKALISNCMNLSLLAENVMVKNVTIAEEWMPIKMIRREMLINSFSYIPIYKDENWFLISELNILLMLGVKYGKDRSLKEKDIIGPLFNQQNFEIATTINNDSSITDVLEKLLENNGKPILIVSQDDNKNLLGIITTYDIL